MKPAEFLVVAWSYVSSRYTTLLAVLDWRTFLEEEFSAQLRTQSDAQLGSGTVLKWRIFLPAFAEELSAQL